MQIPGRHPVAIALPTYTLKATTASTPCSAHEALLKRSPCHDMCNVSQQYRSGYRLLNIPGHSVLVRSILAANSLRALCRELFSSLVIPHETGLREQDVCLFRPEAEPYRAAMCNVAAPCSG